jgi:hypothetical protein
MEAKDGTSHADGVAQINARFPEIRAEGELADPFKRSRAMNRAAMEMLAELGPVPIAKAWVFGAAINLLSPALILTSPVRALPRTGFYDTPGETKADKVVNFLFHNDNRLYGWLLLLSSVGTLLCRVVQLNGAWRMLRNGLGGDRLGLVLGLWLAAWIGFVLAINGPIASAKYRAPMEPVLAVLIAAGWTRRNPFTDRHETL